MTRGAGGCPPAGARRGHGLSGRAGAGGGARAPGEYTRADGRPVGERGGSRGRGPIECACAAGGAGPASARRRTPALTLTRPIEQLDRFGPDADRSAPPPSPDEARRYVRALAGRRYENFSVLSSLVPERLRDDFAAVYAFCRWSDDLGDETGSTVTARARSIELLDWWRSELESCFAAALPERYGGPSGSAAGGEPPPEVRHPVFVALADVIRRRDLPDRPFHDLIDAFVQDQHLLRYQTWEQLIDYSSRSANPVGRLVLMLGGYSLDEPEHEHLFAMSDATCTALQLTNFWQDARRDLLERDRVYLPLSEMGLTEAQLRDWLHRPNDAAARVPFIRALRPLCERTRQLYETGKPLPAALNNELSPVVWLFWAGGRSVLRSIDRIGCATLWERPTLSRVKKASLVAAASVRFRLHRERGCPAA